MNNFEATLLFSPDLTAKKIESMEKFFEKHVTNMGGSIVAKEDWGLRDLSYKIKNAKKEAMPINRSCFPYLVLKSSIITVSSLYCEA